MTEHFGKLRKPKQNQVSDAGWTVFLVDDDYDDLRLTERILKKSPYIKNVHCITNSSDLFQELHLWHVMGDYPERPDSMIILDIHMPGVDGISLLNQLRTNPYTEKTPIMILTGDGGTDKIERTYYMQANGFIIKPLEEENLSHIHRVLEKGGNWRAV